MTTLVVDTRVYVKLLKETGSTEQQAEFCLAIKHGAKPALIVGVVATLVKLFWSQRK